LAQELNKFRFCQGSEEAYRGTSVHFGHCHNVYAVRHLCTVQGYEL